ncbi:hypothetical protein [Pseudofrankia sp. DC12]|uniref:hypothetical protein n=1 Tax=Pseudofrankia sp. DC12 TaxID=683315 RepID=UPI0005F86BB4|nr:hypothetical protein [Pseudofrankia sp. DC12]
MQTGQTARTDEMMRQLSLPGVLVLVSTPSADHLVADNVGWHRTVAQAGLPRATKLVALVLSSHVQPAGVADLDLPAGAAFCAPGLPVLVEQTGYSRTHVQRQLAKLRELGWLSTVGRPAAGRPARFVLTLPADVARSAGVGVARPSEAPTASQTSAASQAAAAGPVPGPGPLAASAGSPVSSQVAATARPAAPVWRPLQDGPVRTGLLDRGRVPGRVPDEVVAAAAAGWPRPRRAARADGAVETAVVEWEEDEEQVTEEDGPLTATGERPRVIVGRHVFRRRGGRPLDNSKAAVRRRAQVVGAFLGSGPATDQREDTPLGRLADELLPPTRIITDESSTPTRIIIEDRSFAPGTEPFEPATPNPAGSPQQATGERLTGTGLAGGPPPAVRRTESTESTARRTEPGGNGPGSAGAAGRDQGPTPALDEPAPLDGPTALDEVPEPAVAPPPQVAPDPVVVAARQVVTTLAQAMRCEPEMFADSVDGLTDILREGGWTAPTLATHLVHLVVGGVKVGSDSPGDNLAWRLKHLPRASDQCPCAACRGWRNAQAQAPAQARPAREGEDGPALPDVAEIERAAALGAEQAALLARARAS